MPSGTLLDFTGPGRHDYDYLHYTAAAQSWREPTYGFIINCIQDVGSYLNGTDVNMLVIECEAHTHLCQADTAKRRPQRHGQCCA